MAGIADHFGVPAAEVEDVIRVALRLTARVLRRLSTADLQALAEHRVRAFCGTNGNLRGVDQANRLVANLASIMRVAERPGPSNRTLRRDFRARAALVVLAAALVAYPLRSELWWPSCALVMLLATVVGARGALYAAACVLSANLAAHVIAGDLDETPAVSVIGLWIGFGFWPMAFALLPDRLNAYVLGVELRRNARRTERLAPRRVEAVAVQPPPTSPPGTAVAVADGRTDADLLASLTARQLQVTALLIDGCRYDEIAACLSISERQVQRHVGLACRRVGVANATELAARAVAAGMVTASAT